MSEVVRTACDCRLVLLVGVHLCGMLSIHAARLFRQANSEDAELKEVLWTMPGSWTCCSCPGAMLLGQAAARLSRDRVLWSEV